MGPPCHHPVNNVRNSDVTFAQQRDQYQKQKDSYQKQRPVSESKRRVSETDTSKGTPRAGTKSYRAQSQSPPRAYHNGYGGSPTYGDGARERTYSYTKFFDKASSFADKGFGGNFAGTGRVFGEGLSAGSSAYEKRRSRSKSRSRTKTTADGEMIDEIITGEDGVFDGSPQPEDDIDVDLVKPAFALRGLNNKLAAHMDRMKILEEENSFLRKQIDVLTHSDSALGEARRQMEKLIAEKKKLEDQLAAQKNDIEKNKENVAIHIDKLRAVQQQNRELAAKTKNFAKAIELEREESGSKIAKLEDEIKALKRMKYEWSIEEDTLTKENKESTSKIAQLEEEIGRLKSDLDERNVQINQLLTDNQNMKIEQENSKAERDKFMSEQEQLKDEQQKLKTEMEESELEKAKEEDAQSKIKTMEEEYMKLKMAIDQVEKTVAPRLRHAKEQCDRVMKEKGELEKELSEVEKKSQSTGAGKLCSNCVQLDVLLECEYLTLAIGSVDQASSQIMEWWHSNEFQVTRPAAPPPYPGVPGVSLSPMSGRRLSLGSSTETKYSQNTRRLSQPAMTRTQSLQSLCEATDEEQVGESKPQVTHHISRLRERLQHGRELFRGNRATSSEPRTDAEENGKRDENSDDKTRSYSQPTTINEANILQNRPVQQARPLAPLSKAGHIPKYQQQANNKAAATCNYNREKPGNSSAAHHAVSFREQLKQGRKPKSAQSASSPSQSYDLGQNVNPETTSTSLQESEKAMKHMEAAMQQTKGIKNLTDSRKFTGYNLQKETSHQDTQKLHVSMHVAEAIDQSHTRRVKNINDLEQKVKETRTFLDDYEDKLKIKGKEQVNMTVHSSSVKQKLLEVDTLLTTVKGQLGYTGVLESQLREANKRLEETNEQVKRLNEEKRNSPLRGNLSLQQHKDNLLQPDNSIKEEGVITTSMLGMASSDLAIRDKQNKDIATEEVCNLQQMQNESSAVKLENDELKQIVPELKNILIKVRAENLRLRGQCEKQARDITAVGTAHEERERAWKVLVEDHNLLKEKYDKMSAVMENMVKEKEQNESKVQQLCSQLEEMESRNLHLQQQTKNIETVKLNLSTTKELQTDADEILETHDHWLT
ncbi:PREDICTED: girdin-like [Branchiostoma belcheri]|uniref:Girdin-like n=1 Tax=Branchiostoma belcheri TaxID=7741 RepID=A0A6P4Z0D1_BRABE|nr:PREDICTED: girdin-like [Branchiostoma belcheri]